MSLIEKIELVETNISIDKLNKEMVDCIDTNGMRRFWIIIKWKNNENVQLFIRDLLRIRYSPTVKYLKPISFSYIAQKSNINNNSNDLTSAGITIEPLNNDFEKYISLIPISQKLKLGTEFIFNKEIPYNVDKNGQMQNRLFISSDNLECKDKDVKNPILKHVHIGAMEIGSQLKMKFKVEKTSHIRDGSTFCLFNFRRDPNDEKFIINHYNYWQLNSKELFEYLLNFVENEYTEPIINFNDANDHGANILDKKLLIDGLKEIISKLPLKPIEVGPIEILEKYI